MGGFQIGPWGPVANAWFQGKGIAQQEKTARDTADVNRWQTKQSVFGQKAQYDEQVRQALIDEQRLRDLDAENIRQFGITDQRLKDQNILDKTTRLQIQTQKDDDKARAEANDRTHWLMQYAPYLGYTKIHQEGQRYYRELRDGIAGEIDPEVETAILQRPTSGVYWQDPQLNQPMLPQQQQDTRTRDSQTRRDVADSVIGVNEARIPMYDAQTNLYAEKARLLGPEFELKYWKIHEIDAPMAQAYIDNAYQNISESQFGMQMDSAQFQLDQQKQQVTNANILIDNITNMLRLDPNNIDAAQKAMPQIISQLGGIYSYWGEDGDAIAKKFLDSVSPYTQKYGGGLIGDVIGNMVNAYEVALNSKNIALQKSILLDLADLNAKLAEMIANMPTIQAPSVPTGETNKPGKIPAPGEAGYPDLSRTGGTLPLP